MDERSQPPHPPYEDYRQALGEDSEGHAVLDDLQRELHADAPRPTHVEASARRLRSIATIEAQVANWWESPRTQNWLKIIADAGL